MPDTHFAGVTRRTPLGHYDPWAVRLVLRGGAFWVGLASGPDDPAADRKLTIVSAAADVKPDGYTIDIDVPSPPPLSRAGTSGYVPAAVVTLTA